MDDAFAREVSRYATQEDVLIWLAYIAWRDL